MVQYQQHVGETTNKGIMNDRKTQRKNKTNLIMKWPPNDDYFVISPGYDDSMAHKALMTLNPDFIEITLRVRLKKEIEEKKTIVEIGCKNTGFGRPIKAFVMLPVNQLAMEKAKADGIMLNSQPVSIIHVTSPTSVLQTSVTNITKPITVVA